jgi:hypothetical protein
MMMTPSFAREIATLTLFPRKRSQPLCRTVAVGAVDNDNSGRVTLSRVVAEDARVVLQTQQRLLGCLALLFDLSVLILDDLTPVVPGRAVRTDDRNLLVHLVAEDSMQKNTATSRTTEDMVVLNFAAVAFRFEVHEAERIVLCSQRIRACNATKGTAKLGVVVEKLAVVPLVTNEVPMTLCMRLCSFKKTCERLLLIMTVARERESQSQRSR